MGDTIIVVSRRLGRSNLQVSPVGFGAFKIGRNLGIKYAGEYDLPDQKAVDLLLGGVLDLGITYFDTAPAYGLSEERLGRALIGRRDEIVVSTKVGETFREGHSTYDFSVRAIRQSVERSLRLLRRETIDLLLIHADDDQRVLHQTDAVPTLLDIRKKGDARAIGLSAKTVDGARQAMEWSDVLMVEYHLDDLSQADVIAEAAKADVGVVVKKGLASGQLDPEPAIQLVLGTQGVGSLVVGSLTLEHLEQNVGVAATVL